MSLETVQQVVTSRARVSSADDYSDGDAYRSYQFKRCNRNWQQSLVYVSFWMSEYEVWVPDIYCSEYSGCHDYGDYETRYRLPLIASSKSAYWG